VVRCRFHVLSLLNATAYTYNTLQRYAAEAWLINPPHIIRVPVHSHRPHSTLSMPSGPASSGVKKPKSAATKNLQRLKRFGKSRPLFRAHVARILRSKLPAHVSMSSLAVSMLSEMTEYVLERVQSTAGGICRNYTNGVTLSAPVVKGAFGLTLPYDVRQEVCDAGLFAIKKLELTKRAKKPKAAKAAN
jgi:hypothetical protein